MGVVVAEPVATGTNVLRGLSPRWESGPLSASSVLASPASPELRRSLRSAGFSDFAAGFFPLEGSALSRAPPLRFEVVESRFWESGSRDELGMGELVASGNTEVRSDAAPFIGLDVEPEMGFATVGVGVLFAMLTLPLTVGNGVAVTGALSRAGREDGGVTEASPIRPLSAFRTLSCRSLDERTEAASAAILAPTVFLGVRP